MRRRACPFVLGSTAAVVTCTDSVTEPRQLELPPELTYLIVSNAVDSRAHAGAGGSARIAYLSLPRGRP